MRDQDGGAVPGGGQQAIENLGFPAHIELRGGLIEQHDAGARVARRPARGPERIALPLAARQISAAVVPASENRVQPGQVRCARRFERSAHDLVGRASGGYVVAERQFQADEVLENGRDARAPRGEIELAQVDAVDLDRARLRIVQPAQQFCQSGLAGAVLSRRWRAMSRRGS